MVYKAYFAIKELNTSNGKPVNALFGLARMLTKLLKEYIHPGDHVVFLMDQGRTTFRTKLMEEYKAQRPPMPESLREQMKSVSSLVEGFGIAVFSMEGFEADDLIATYARKFQKECDQIWIITSDKDLFQLINDRVNVLRAEKGITDLVIYDAQKVREKYGILPDQMIDYLSIVGDKVDNIPGVLGIGEKGALQLLQTFPTLEDIYSNIEKVPEKLAEKLLKSKAEAFLSKQLVTLIDDIALEHDWDHIEYRGANRRELQSIFSTLEFKSLQHEWAPTLFESQAEVTTVVANTQAVSISTVDDPQSFQRLLEKINHSTVVAFHTQTNLSNALDAKLMGISISVDENQSYYIPVAQVGVRNLDVESIHTLFSILKEKRVVGHDLKYHFNVLYNHRYPLPLKYFDTMIAAYLLDADRQKYKLRDLIQEFDTVEKRNDQMSVKDFPESVARDSAYSLRLFHRFALELEKSNLTKLFESVEMPLVGILAAMERTGVYFDTEELKGLSVKMEARLRELSDQIFQIAGVAFNLNSPQQLGKILFEKLGLPTKKNTSKSKNYSTEKSVLEELASQYEIAALLLDYRKFSKLKSTYVDSIPPLIHPRTRRVHTSFNQTGTATGRLSSSDPNLQNLPVKNEEGKEIRAVIKPQKEGWVLISTDYSQIELRIMAHLSGDKNLIQAFLQRQDVHSYTASKLFRIPISEVDERQRRIGKMINFSIIYGVSSFGLSSRLGIGRKEAGRFIDAYFQAYPDVKRYMNEEIKTAQQTDYVRTLFGRMRKIQNIHSSNSTLKQEAERMAINTPIQGSAADIVKIAMIHIYQKITEKHLQSKLILQVHDELVFEVPKEEIEEMKKLMTEEMEQVIVLAAPLKVDIEVGNHY